MKIQRFALPFRKSNVVVLVVAVVCLLATPATTVVDGCCNFDCPWDAPNCTDPCDTMLDTDFYFDTSCQSNCCQWGQCFILERNGPSEPCVWMCYADQFAQCEYFTEPCAV